MLGSTFLGGLRAALPIVLGYLPIAFSFGVAATRAGLTPLEATMLSLVIYAGAAQFVTLALVTSGAPLLASALTLIAMNLRHVLYGPALMKAAGEGARQRRAALWGFGLTDEVFGTALGLFARGTHRFSEPLMFGLAIAAYASWVIGTVVGAYAGGGALARWPAADAGLGFMLPALFLALLLSIASRRQMPVIAAAALATALGTALLSPGLGILAGMLTGALIGLGLRDAA